MSASRFFGIFLTAALAVTFAVAGAAVGEEKTACKACKECKAKECDTQVAAAKNPEDVWWGNRGVSFRNYIKFDRVDVAKPAAAEKPTFEPIYFDLDKAVLRPDGIAIADKVVQYMTQNSDERVLIEGHCCDLATTDYNIGLGQRRADAVKKYVVEHGIDASRIDTVSYGEDKRATTAPDDRPLNRRAIVVVKCGG